MKREQIEEEKYHRNTCKRQVSKTNRCEQFAICGLHRHTATLAAAFELYGVAVPAFHTSVTAQFKYICSFRETDTANEPDYPKRWPPH
jgi:hypothetical protein